MLNHDFTAKLLNLEEVIITNVENGMCQPIVGRNKTYAIREFDYSFNSPKGRLLSTNLINGQEAEISAWRGYSYPLPTFSIASR